MDTGDRAPTTRGVGAIGPAASAPEVQALLAAETLREGLEGDGAGAGKAPTHTQNQRWKCGNVKTHNKKHRLIYLL